MFATLNLYRFGPGDGPAMLDFKAAEIPLLRAHPRAHERMLLHQVANPTAFVWLSFWDDIPAMHAFGQSTELQVVRAGFFGRISGMQEAARYDLELVANHLARPPVAGDHALVVRGAIAGVAELTTALADVAWWRFDQVGEAGQGALVAVLSQPPAGTLESLGTHCVVDLHDAG